MACGRDFSLVVTEDGTVYSFGESTDGQLAQGDVYEKIKPMTVPLERVEQVWCGRDHVFARTEDGSTYAWGYNGDEELGFTTAKGYRLLIPEKNPQLDKFVDFYPGAYHTLALDAEGYLWGWGRTSYCGFYKDDILDKGPNKVPGLQNIVSAAAGLSHSIALAQDGTLYGWGNNSSTQLNIPLGESDFYTLPTKIPFPTDSRIVGIFSGSNQCGVATADGKLTMFGYAGRCGNLQDPRVPQRWQLPCRRFQNRWRLVYKWLFLGRLDQHSVLKDFPLECIYHAVSVAR
jgi:alpha-tubulin suppressor-like RCC1 family protein